MNLRFRTSLLVLVAIAASACATGPAPVYPPIEGGWIYDYAASINDTGELPQIPQEWLSELKQDADPTRDRLLVLRNPPEILAIERMGNRLYIRGGGRFERTYLLDGTPPSPVSEIKFSADSIIATHREPEMTITEVWKVSPEGTTLLVGIRVETPKLPKPIDVVRIYRSSRAF